MDWQKSLEKLNQLNIGGNLEYQETLTSSVTTSWGVAWDEELIARDIMQNFFDANRDRLTELLGTVIENRNDLDVYEELWNDARTKVCEERNESGNNNKEIEVMLNSKNEMELRELLQRVPNRVPRRLLEPNENKVAA